MIWICLCMLMHMSVAWGAEIIDVDKVVVYKAQRELQLCEGDSVLARYKIALGQNVMGHKQREGDSRTPEGRYLLDWRNENSKYYLSIHISYPNAEDENRAEDLGVSPGGDIFIHGYPNGISRGLWSRYWFLGKDWTDGCIAVSNEAMDVIWASVKMGTPIEIYP